MVSAVRTGETLDPGVIQVVRTLNYPKFVKKIYAWIIRYLYRDPVWADLIENLHEKTVSEEWKLVVQRDDYRARWHAAWQEEKLDFLLTVPNAMPAIPSGGMKNATVAMASYVFLFNVVSKFIELFSELSK